MKMQRFFIEEKVTGDKMTLHDEALIHQLRNVFRKNVGDKVTLLDNTGFELVAEISLLGKKEIDFKIIQKNAAKNMPQKEVTLFCSIIKKDNFELVAEKATELGVSRIAPILSERSEKKDINVDRLQKIIKEASEQSERGMLPVLEPTKTLEQALKECGTDNSYSLIAFHTEGQKIEPPTMGIYSRSLVRFGILIGPEGGWTDEEISFFKQHGVKIICLGHQILRAETAAIVGVTLALFSGQKE